VPSGTRLFRDITVASNLQEQLRLSPDTVEGNWGLYQHAGAPTLPPQTGTGRNARAGTNHARIAAFKLNAKARMH
jgi:hypothetical protein